MEHLDSQKLLDSFILWRQTHISEKNFILFLSLLVGIFTALAAYILKLLIHFFQHFLTLNFSQDGANGLYLVYPVVGILLSGCFVRYIVRDDISHGVTKILFAIAGRRGKIRRHNIWSSICASSVTIGFGGSVGAEAPIVLTGSAIGSNLGTLFRMDHKTLMLLIGCGAAGAVSGIFKAPIAGLCFTLEVLMIDLTMASLLPLLVTSVTAAIFSYLLMGADTIFDFNLDEVFLMRRIPYVILLGILCGLVSLYFTRAMGWIEGFFGRWKNPWKRFAVGACILSVLIFLFPPLYGEGYDTIELLINGTTPGQWNSVMDNSLFYNSGSLLLLYLVLIVLFKVFASSATNGGGGCGGIFAPSLFLGCITGFAFSHFSNSFDFTVYCPEKNFALIGMAGVMSGVMHAPLTGIFLIAELTGGYDLLLPLMICSVCSYLTIILFEPHSIYSMRLAKKGQLLTHHKDKTVLLLMTVDTVLERNERTITKDSDLREIVNLLSRFNRNLLPVVDSKQSNKLIGVVSLDDIRNFMFRPELYHRYTAARFMKPIPFPLHINDTMEQVMHAFEETKSWELPVVDADGTFVGFVLKSKILEAYRRLLIHYSED